MANETINDPRLDDPRLEEGVWTTDPESGELVPDYESTFPTINEGEVVHGAHRGHILGFPTANLKTANELIPAYGVYAVLAQVDNHRLKGVASVGVRPTFDSGPVSLEVYLFDFANVLYGRQMDVSFVKRLRGEEKFPDAESLVRQIRKDVQKAELVLQGL